MKRQIIVLSGLPLTGKTTLGKELKNYLNILFLDIDEIRQKLFQHPKEEMLPEKDLAQRMASYKELFFITNYLIRSNLSLIIAATFSKKQYHNNLVRILENNIITVKAVYCYASDKDIKERVTQRDIEKSSFSTCRTFEHYIADKKRYETLPIVGLTLNTSQPVSVCLQEISKFIKS